MQDNRSAIDSQNNDVIEVDLRDIWRELVQAKKLIIGATVGFAVVAAIYSFAIAKPVYGYTALIQFPNSVGGSQLNSYVEIIKDDIDPDNKEVNKLAEVSLMRNTAVIKMSFEGESNEAVKAFADAYMEKTVAEINKSVVDNEKQKFAKEDVKLIKEEINYISSKINESTFSGADADARLKYLTERLEKRDANQMFIKAEVANEAKMKDKPIRPKKVRNIGIAAVLGLFFSSAFVISRFLWKQQ